MDRKVFGKHKRLSGVYRKAQCKDKKELYYKSSRKKKEDDGEYGYPQETSPYAQIKDAIKSKLKVGIYKKGSHTTGKIKDK